MIEVFEVAGFADRHFAVVDDQFRAVLTVRAADKKALASDVNRHLVDASRDTLKRDGALNFEAWRLCSHRTQR